MLFPFSFPSFMNFRGLFAGLWWLLSSAGLVLYVLRSWGLYKMAGNTGVPNAWFAWVPVLHEYLCAKLGDRTRQAQGKAVFLEKSFIVALAVNVGLRIFLPVFRRVFLVGLLYQLLSSGASLILWGLAVAADYWMYVDYEPSMSALYALLSVFRLDGIAKLLVRDNVPVGVAGVCSPKQPKYQK